MVGLFRKFGERRALQPPFAIRTLGSHYSNLGMSETSQRNDDDSRGDSLRKCPAA